jgi:hypothetical protein
VIHTDYAGFLANFGPYVCKGSDLILLFFPNPCGWGGWESIGDGGPPLPEYQYGHISMDFAQFQNAGTHIDGCQKKKLEPACFKPPLELAYIRVQNTIY